MLKKNKIIAAFIFLLLAILILLSCKEDNLVNLITNNYDFVTIDEISPTDNELEVQSKAAISIKFSQAISSDTFNEAFSLTSNGVQVAISNYTVSWSADRTIVTLSNPVSDLTKDVTNKIRISSGIRSSNGNPMAYEYNSTFFTGHAADTISPQITNVTLLASSGDIAGSSNISGNIDPTITGVKFDFSEAMVKTSVESAFSFTANNTSITPVSTVWSNANATVIFQIAGLPQNNECIIKLTDAALDKGGNKVSNPIGKLEFYYGLITGADSDETNNSWNTATPLILNTAISKNNIFESGDEDWYSVSLINGANYNIHLKNLPNNYNITLYMPDGTTPIDSSTYTGTTDELLNYTPATTGTYYLRVFAANGSDNSTSPYYILAEQVNGDDYEPNDNSTSGATAIAANSTASDHTLHVNSDEDYFSFTAINGTSYTVNLNNVPSTANYDVEILNSSMVQQSLGNNTGLGSSESFTFTASTAAESETFYIKVYSATGSSTSYYSLNLSSSAGVEYYYNDDSCPNTAITNGSESVTFTLLNGGGTSGSETVNWEIYLSENDEKDSGDTLVDSGSLSPLSSAGSSICTATVTWPSSSGTYYLIAMVAADDDTNADNNTRVSDPINVSATVTADYEFSSATIPATPTTNATYSNIPFILHNDGGDTNSSDVSWEIYLSTDTSIGGGDSLIGSGSIAGLDAGETETIESDSGNWPSAPGTYYIIARLSASDDSNNANDTFVSDPIIVSATVTADYEFSSATIPATPITDAAFSNIPFILHNDGGDTNGSAVNWEVYLSTDTTIGDGDSLIGSGTIASGLDADDNQTIQTNTGTWPSAAGTYYLIARLSAADDSDSSNNTFSSEITVASSITPELTLILGDSAVPNVTIKWNTVTDAESYYIYHSGGSSPIAITSDTQYTHTTSGLGDHCYQIRAYSASNGLSNLSPPLCITLDPPPKTIDSTNLTLWLKAEDVSYVGNGNPVSYWPDTSGKNNDLISSNQPTYIKEEATLNGKAIIRFDTGQYLEGPPVATGHDITVLVVSKRSNNAGTEIISQEQATSLHGFRLFYDSDTFMVNLSNIMESDSSNGDSLSLNQFYVIGFSPHPSIASSTRLICNNSIVNKTINASAQYTSGGIYIGTNREINKYLQGDIAEVLIWNTTFSEAALNTAINYLRDKYGL